MYAVSSDVSVSELVSKNNFLFILQNIQGVLKFKHEPPPRFYSLLFLSLFFESQQNARHKALETD